MMARSHRIYLIMSSDAYVPSLVWDKRFELESREDDDAVG